MDRPAMEASRRKREKRRWRPGRHVEKEEGVRINKKAAG